MPRTKKTEIKLDNQLRPPKITVKNLGLTEKQKDLVRLGIDDNNKVIFIA